MHPHADNVQDLPRSIEYEVITAVICFWRNEAECPLYSQKRTSLSTTTMSVKCQKATSSWVIRSTINQDFIDLFGEQCSVLVSYR
jgi:hypothetical protein